MLLDQYRDCLTVFRASSDLSAHLSHCEVGRPPDQYDEGRILRLANWSRDARVKREIASAVTEIKRLRGLIDQLTCSY